MSAGIGDHIHLLHERYCATSDKLSASEEKNLLESLQVDNLEDLVNTIEKWADAIPSLSNAERQECYEVLQSLADRGMTETSEKKRATIAQVFSASVAGTSSQASTSTRRQPRTRTRRLSTRSDRQKVQRERRKPDRRRHGMPQPGLTPSWTDLANVNVYTPSRDLPEREQELIQTMQRADSSDFERQSQVSRVTVDTPDPKTGETETRFLFWKNSRAAAGANMEVLVWESAKVLGDEKAFTPTALRAHGGKIGGMQRLTSGTEYSMAIGKKGGAIVYGSVPEEELAKQLIEHASTTKSLREAAESEVQKIEKAGTRLKSAQDHVARALEIAHQTATPDQKRRIDAVFSQREQLGAGDRVQLVENVTLAHATAAMVRCITYGMYDAHQENLFIASDGGVRFFDNGRSFPESNDYIQSFGSVVVPPIKTHLTSLPAAKEKLSDKSRDLILVMVQNYRKQLPALERLWTEGKGADLIAGMPPSWWDTELTLSALTQRLDRLESAAKDRSVQTLQDVLRAVYPSLALHSAFAVAAFTGGKATDLTLANEVRGLFERGLSNLSDEEWQSLQPWFSCDIAQAPGIDEFISATVEKGADPDRIFSLANQKDKPFRQICEEIEAYVQECVQIPPSPDQRMKNEEAGRRLSEQIYAQTEPAMKDAVSTKGRSKEGLLFTVTCRLGVKGEAVFRDDMLKTAISDMPPGTSKAFLALSAEPFHVLYCVKSLEGKVAQHKIAVHEGCRKFQLPEDAGSNRWLQVDELRDEMQKDVIPYFHPELTSRPAAEEALRAEPGKCFILYPGNSKGEVKLTVKDEDGSLSSTTYIATSGKRGPNILKEKEFKKVGPRPRYPLAEIFKNLAADGYHGL